MVTPRCWYCNCRALAVAAAATGSRVEPQCACRYSLITNLTSAVDRCLPNSPHTSPPRSPLTRPMNSGTLSAAAACETPFTLVEQPCVTPRPLFRRNYCYCCGIAMHWRAESRCRVRYAGKMKLNAHVAARLVIYAPFGARVLNHRGADARMHILGYLTCCFASLPLRLTASHYCAVLDQHLLSFSGTEDGQVPRLGVAS